MKKIFAAAVAAIIAVSMTACGGDSGTASDDTTAASTTAAETADSVTESKTETEAETESETETEAETTTEAETSTESETASEAASADGDNLFEGNGYTISVDPAVWMDYSDYLDKVAAQVEKVDVGVEITEEQVQDMGDSMFMHTSSTGTNFNVVVVPGVGEKPADFEMSQLGDVMEAQFSAVEGMTYLGDETVEVNGMEALKVDVDMSGAMKMTQYIFIENGTQFGITYTALTADYDKCLADFEAVVNSISFE